MCFLAEHLLAQHDVQVASEWLFSCPDAKLDRLLHGSGPATPAGEEADDAPVLAPRRVTTLQVHYIEICHTEMQRRLARPTVLLMSWQTSAGFVKPEELAAYQHP